MIHRNPWDGWPPPAESLWLVDGTMVATVMTRNADDTGDVGAQVAMRLGSRLNLSGASDDRTFVLGLDEVAGLIGALMGAGNQAFGRGAMVAAMADHLGIDPGTRDRTTTAVDDALDGLDP